VQAFPSSMPTSHHTLQFCSPLIPPFMLYPRDKIMNPSDIPYALNLATTKLIAICIAIAISCLLVFIGLYTVDRLVIMWPSSPITVRSRHSPPSYGRPGTFIGSLPSCICIWHTTEAPRQKLRLYSLHQFSVLHTSQGAPPPIARSISLDTMGGVSLDFPPLR
jgi:hypothetical protein